jgi:cyclopropane-fatty-acyl-phospholipid synthase
MSLISMLARNSILSLLEDAITIGQLTISDSEGTHHYGTSRPGCNQVHIQIVSDNFWMRILM